MSLTRSDNRYSHTPKSNKQENRVPGRGGSRSARSSLDGEEKPAFFAPLRPKTYLQVPSRIACEKT